MEREGREERGERGEHREEEEGDGGSEGKNWGVDDKDDKSVVNMEEIQTFESAAFMQMNAVRVNAEAESSLLSSAVTCNLSVFGICTV